MRHQPACLRALGTSKANQKIDVPNQDNNVDCGLFVYEFMERISAGV